MLQRMYISLPVDIGVLILGLKDEVREVDLSLVQG
jgi:hypothetical protein